jgi:putative transposase
MIQQRKRYDSDISDQAWLLIKHIIPQCRSNKSIGGRPEVYSRREVVNSILYVLTTGCSWSDVPHDLPGRGVAWRCFSAWSRQKVFIRISRFMRKYTRKQLGKSDIPTILIIDSQTAKCTANTSESGYDAGKKTKGRKRHHVTDTNGIIIQTKVHSAHI